MTHKGFFTCKGKCLCPDCRQAEKKQVNSKSVRYIKNRKGINEQ